MATTREITGTVQTINWIFVNATGIEVPEIVLTDGTAIRASDRVVLPADGDEITVTVREAPNGRLMYRSGLGTV